ncbi:uncharacterized protein [Montipora capricornis]|uniref:uncharacterized protein n=1 Tax=Montipora capricornis TaxID=246305 RepID=UPI0035F211D1
MATDKPKTIDDEIDDIGEMYELLKALGLSCKGLKTLDEMKTRVKNEFHKESASEPGWTAGKAYSILSEAKEEDERKRSILLNLYRDASQCIKELDEKIRHLLQHNVSNVEEKMQNLKERLARKEYFILVAGETSSGKSSLINLILGEELLPYSVLSTTSTICELKFGDERKIVAHFKDKDPETGLATKVIPLHKTDPGEASDEQSYLQQISPFVHVKNDREKGSIYKKIELFWPHSLLQQGIVIIDSPGVGESNIMDQIVTQYLSQAFAFIYTINSTNAGGVQKDRLENLLEQVRKLSVEGQGKLQSKCALFVCNKWDQVPKNEARDVKDHVVKSLERCWPSLDPMTQIIYMSTKRATQGQNLGIITEDFSSLMEGIKLMVLKNIECQLELQWRWLECLLGRVTFQLKAFLANASRDRQNALVKMSNVRQRLAGIESKQNMVMPELAEYLTDRVKGAIKELSHYLETEEVRKRFASWTLDDVPNVEGSWEVTQNGIMKAISKRLRDIIQQWEEDNKVFANARESLIKHFQQRYKFVEAQLRNLHRAVTEDNKHVSPTSFPETRFTAGDKVAIGLLSPIWVPLGLIAVAIGAPFVGIMAIKENIEDKMKLKKYERDKCAFMTKLSAEYLNKVIDDIALDKFVRGQLQEAKLCLEQIKARIPELIQADKMLCEQLNNERRETRVIVDLYQPMLETVSELRGNLSIFGLEEVFGNDISINELDWKEDLFHRLGSGSFAAVYKGKMTKNGCTQPVALKVCNLELNTKNALDIATEVELMRKLEHPFIVKFYGTSLLKTDGSTRVIFVMEECRDDLRNTIFNNPKKCPGKSDIDAALGVCQWLKEITAALKYIHEQGIVHRDFKLANILLSDDDTVRITDVGVSKPAMDITGTLTGTPVYMAPEVFRSEMYECSADIYSLGIMMWEMWFGELAFTKIAEPTLEGFFAIVCDGYRPEPVKNCRRPPHPWDNLMQKCWRPNPDERPTAKECNEVIASLVNTVENQSMCG